MSYRIIVLLFSTIILKLNKSVVFCEPTNIFEKFTNDLNRQFSEIVHSSNVFNDYHENVSATYTDDYNNYNDNLCKIQLFSVINGFNNSDLVAMEMFDAWGKIPSGILLGNYFSPGNYDQCLAINNDKFTSTSTIEQISGQYCLTDLVIDDLNIELGDNFVQMVKIFLKPKGDKKFSFSVGVCLPDTCSLNVMKQLLESALNYYQIKGKISVFKELCYGKNISNPYTSFDIIAFWFFFITLLLLITSTIYDVMKTFQKKQKNRAFLVFSMYTNGKRIFSIEPQNSPDVFYFFNGLRVISSATIIFGHTFIEFGFLPITNIKYLRERFDNGFMSYMIWTSSFAVDSFLILSGLLVSRHILNHFNTRNGEKIKCYLQMYCVRILKFTPALAAVILFSTISPAAMQLFGDGPLWNLAFQTRNCCTKYWWSALLHIQNYVNPTEVCLIHTWHLSVDMQLLMISPLIIYLLWRWKLRVLYVIFSIISFVISYAMFSIFYHYGSATSIVEIISSMDFLSTYYTATHTRMYAWLLGVMLGYLLTTYKQFFNSLSKRIIVINWLLFAFFIIITFCTIIHLSTYPVLISMFPLLFGFYSLSFAWIIISCLHGYSGPINWFLSLPAWQPIARISYSIYLLHMLVQSKSLISARESTDFNYFKLFHRFFGDTCMTIVIATILTLAFESPIKCVLFLIKEKKSRNVKSNSHNGKDD